MAGIVNRLVSVVACRPHPRNYNRHDAGQVADLRDSLRAFGQVRSIVVQEDGAGGFLVVAGHGVTEAARLEGLAELRVRIAHSAGARSGEALRDCARLARGCRWGR